MLSAFTDLILKHRRWVVVCGYLLLIIVANLLAFFLRFDWTIPAAYYAMILQTLPLIALVRMGTFHFYGVHRGSWRYASIRDLLNIVKAVSLSSVILVLVVYFFLGFHRYPRSIYVIDWLLLIVLMGGVRFHWRISRELWHLRVDGGKRVLLIGAGDAGEMILREMKQNAQLSYQPIGFIDDDVRKRGLNIHGVPVLGTRKELLAIAKQYNVEEIIIAVASVRAKQMREIVEDCKKTGLNLKVVPSIGSVLNGHVSLSQIRDVRLEDLLYRDVVKIDTANISAYLRNKRVLVTGAAGSIGAELCRQIAGFYPSRIILFDQAESNLCFTALDLEADHPEVSIVPVVGDIQDVKRVRDTMKRWQPNIIFHAAAYKHVPLLESNVSEAIKNNILATRDLATIAHEFAVDEFVLISTDKAVNPTSVMGATKRVAELFVRMLSGRHPTRFVVVRFGNVLGSDGSVIPLFRKQIEAKRPVTVTHPEARRYFMTISEASQLVLQASMMGRGGEVFVLDMGEQVKILDLAKHMITLSGYVPDEDIPITIIGMRPGEKLYEELFDRSEDIQPTAHKKIMKALSSKPGDLDLLVEQIQELEHLVEVGDDREIIRALKKIVPSYKTGLSQPSSDGLPSASHNLHGSDQVIERVPEGA